jgi:hypothetical protein
MTSSLLDPRQRATSQALRALVAAALGVVAAAHSSQALCATPGPTQSVSVDDPRPIDKAIEILQSKYGYIITYEDPRYVYAGDLKDITQEIRTSVDPRYKRIKTLVPVGGTVNLSLPMASSVNDSRSMAAVLTQLLQSHAALQRDGRFRLEQTGDVFHIVPAEIQDADGTWRSQVPPLDYAITVSKITNANGLTMLHAICAALTKAGARVFEGTVPLNVLNQYRGDLEAENESARSVLLRMLAATGSRLAWSLLYDPNLKAYFLNISVVMSKPASSADATQAQIARSSPSHAH